MNKLLVFIGILLLGFVSIANGDSFRCGNWIISTGDSKMEVISKCGPPDDSETVSVDMTTSETRKGEPVVIIKKVEKLYYNCGEGRISRLLTFIDGKLVMIENAGYGFGPEKCK
jgi:hypothetical protein